MYLICPCCWGSILGTKSLLPPIIISVKSFQEVDPELYCSSSSQHHGELPESEGGRNSSPATRISMYTPAVGVDLVVKGVGAVMSVAICSHQRPREGCGQAGR